MNDDAIRDLARRAGIAVQWRDYANKNHRVPLEVVKRILAALGLPSDTAGDLRHSRDALETRVLTPLVVATEGHGVDLLVQEKGEPKHVRLVHEDGTARDLPVRRTARGLRLPGIKTLGYHTLEIGKSNVMLAVAPRVCVRVGDFAGDQRLWGPVAQIYGLRSAGDCGIGTMKGVAQLAEAAAAQKADAIALSPTHALLAADPGHYSPYSPSSRLFYNPLYADPAVLFDEERIALARNAAGPASSAAHFEAAPLIDWKVSGARKFAVLRRLFDGFIQSDFASGTGQLAKDFADFQIGGGAALAQHALFEALYAAQLKKNPRAWHWRDWSAPLRDPRSSAVAQFAVAHGREILFHSFLQWIADRSAAAAQRAATQAGMRIGVIADLAVGLHDGGSQAWASQNEILAGLQIGAPPDLFNPLGQNWGLTTFSPRALAAGGFSGFIATLRACMRHTGGVRIDHVMGLMRLWVVPEGAAPGEGAYLSYPLTDLLRLVALESHRQRAIVVGEDLGTVPAGFRDLLEQMGIYGMGVLWFERDKGGFIPPKRWPASAVAMTSTHDLPTVAGWWRSKDIRVRETHGLLAQSLKVEKKARATDRASLWKAFTSARAAKGKRPGDNQPRPVADAAVKFMAETPCAMALLPLEDALALPEQPNLPGTIDQHPNWRRRYPGEAETLLKRASVRRRLKPLKDRVVR